MQWPLNVVKAASDRLLKLEKLLEISEKHWDLIELAADFVVSIHDLSMLCIV